MPSVWESLESDCLKIFSLPHNARALADEHLTPADAARRKVKEVQSGLGGSAVRREIEGPRLFLRVVGGRAYSGEWWFDADVLHGLDAAYARIYFSAPDRRAAIRNMLRELFAISTDFRNNMTEVWALAIPAGERLTAYVGSGAPQWLHQQLPPNAPGNRKLVGRAEQYFFPVKNPLWVTSYRSLV